MKTISDKTITILLVVALAVTLAGTIFSFSHLDGFKNGYSSLTGAATTTATGTSTLTITSNTAISNQVSSIAFGSGYVNATGCTGPNACVMDSNAQQNQTGRCCMSFTNVSSGFLLENTGNINISVNYSCSGSCNAAEFIGGTAPNLSIKVTRNSVALQTGEAGATDSVASCLAYANYYFGGWNISASGAPPTANTPEATYFELGSNQNRTLCGNTTHFPLDFTDSMDAAVVDINVTIPVDAPTGAQKTFTVTFNAMSSG